MPVLSGSNSSPPGEAALARFIGKPLLPTLGRRASESEVETYFLGGRGKSRVVTGVLVKTRARSERWTCSLVDSPGKAVYRPGKMNTWRYDWDRDVIVDASTEPCAL